MEEIKKLIAFYENEGKEELRLREDSPQRVEFLTAVRYLERFLPAKSKILDNCAGSGIYAFHLARQGHKVTAGDIVPYNVELIEKEQEKNPLLEAIYTGDARELSCFESQSFDAVLCMGALYHFHEEEDRRRVMDESLRVLKDGGLFVGTYMNRFAVILNNCMGNLSNIDEIMQFAQEGREGIFYASMPDEAEKWMRDAGFEKVCHVALDGMANFLHGTTGLIDDEGLERWQQYHFSVCEEYCLLGSSYHNLIIGRK